MFCKKDQLPVGAMINVRGGEGELTRHAWSATMPANLKFLAAVDIEPGRSIGYHTHDTDAEIYYVLSGELELNDNGTIRTALPGDMMVTCNGEGHAMVNKSREKASFLAFIVDGAAGQ